MRHAAEEATARTSPPGHRHELTDGAVAAASARYERGDHILDGRTGRPATGLLSMTVVAAALTEADSVATAAFAMGTEGVAWAASLAGCGVFAVAADERVLRTEGVPAIRESPAASGRGEGGRRVSSRPRRPGGRGRCRR